MLLQPTFRMDSERVSYIYRDPHNLLVFLGQTNLWLQPEKWNTFTYVQACFGHITSNSVTKSFSHCAWNLDMYLKIGKTTSISSNSSLSSEVVLNTQISRSKNPDCVFTLSLLQQEVVFFVFFFLKQQETRKLTCYLVSALKSESLFSNTELVNEDTQIRYVIYLLRNHHFFTD